MTHTPKRTRPAGASPPAGRPSDAPVRPAGAGVPASSARVSPVPPPVSPAAPGPLPGGGGGPALGGGFALLPFVVERPAGLPATNATWAWSLRRFARHAVWLLPGYAVLYGLLTLTGADGANPAAFLADGRPLHLIGWVIAVWLGLLALMALTGLLVATRSRREAAAGLLVALAGALLMLPFAALPEEVSSTGAKVLAAAGATVYSAGWLLAGWALIRSGVFSYVDGVLLMLAGPMLGVGGMFVSALQTLGAMFALASGIGVAWRAGRLVPQVHPATPADPAAPPATATP